MRVLLAFLLVPCIVVPAWAQTQPKPSGNPPFEIPADQLPRAGLVETDAREVREQLQGLLMKFPPEVGRILKMDPTMLSNQQYLAQYPAIQQFLMAHPEIARNPSFYLDFVRISYDDYTRPLDPRQQAVIEWGRFMEAIGIFMVVAFISGTIAWLVKTALAHRRWLRASRIQTEVHSKLLDRFAGTNELLAYIQTPAGRRFLEAAPIPVDAPTAETPVSAPLNRILWSIQAGIVLVVGGIGFQYVSMRVIDEVAEGLWTIGVLATTFGLGFVAAGAFSYIMSRRLGLLEPSLPPRSSERSDSSVV